jgi:hypothetical protein
VKQISRCTDENGLETAQSNLRTLPFSPAPSNFTQATTKFRAKRYMERTGGEREETVEREEREREEREKRENY